VTNDDNGHLTAFTGETYTWDVRGRLTKLVKGAATYEYQYDPFGMRVGKKVAGAWTYFLLDGDSIVKEITGGSSVHTTQGPVIDQPLARNGRYFSVNHLGSTTTLTDGAGAVVQTYQYGPFGETSQSTGEANPIQYAGRENDGTGLYYNRARYYRPEWGRFISPDPIGFAGGINHYSYTANNPLAGRDPSGMILDTIVDVVGLALDIAAFIEDPSLENGAAIVIGAASLVMPGVPNPGIVRHIINVCFVAGTPIQTATGERPIEQIRAGDLVLSAEPATGKQSFQRVARTFVSESDRILTIVTEDGRCVETTPEHPFFVVSKGFVEAKRLARSDLLVDEKGRFHAVLEVTERAERATVYNFEVAGTHTYYAGGWWVHNACDPYHHIFPQNSRMAQYFNNAGIDVHDYTVQIPQEYHDVLHWPTWRQRGGYWVQEWDSYILANPVPDFNDIWRKGRELMEQFGLENLPFERYPGK
jgi:RHS repeat-associated protein